MPERAPHERPTLCLWGFMASGKSTIGARLARAAEADFVDLDAAIVDRAGCSIANIFAERGEAAFRKLERELLTELIDAPHDAPHNAPHGARVIALGGGALVPDDLRAFVMERAFVVTLDISLDTALRRTKGDATRPLLTGDNRARAEALLEDRRDAYASTHEVIRADAATVDEVVERLSKRWTP